jgi:hypothetical protein
MYVCWFNNQIPKNIKALTNQSLAAANNVLHCFSLLLAESASRIPFKQAHDTQVRSHRYMSGENSNYHFELMPA